MSTNDLSGKVALVTGGGTGIERAVALAFGRAGANVMISGRRPELLEETVAVMADEGADARSVVADVSDETDARAMVDRTVGRDRTSRRRLQQRRHARWFGV
jgi:Short-chain dehydrogenase involved in D-alanine esterification of lipoteichoic acid and wall teichoic acid (D-alanine transfer protein)